MMQVVDIVLQIDFSLNWLHYYTFFPIAFDALPEGDNLPDAKDLIDRFLEPNMLPRDPRDLSKVF
jgi:hypothetical protein